MIQCFDTLTEYIQGPCRENQKALIQGNFLDIASKLFEYDEKLEEFKRESLRRENESKNVNKDEDQNMFNIHECYPYEGSNTMTEDEQLDNG